MMSEKVIFQLEYSLKCSVPVLYNRISTPSGLSDWFSDDVNIKGDIFTFIWDGSEETAEIVGKKENKYVRFRWVKQDKNTYFEFRIEKDELTRDVALIITDFADDDEKDDVIELWNSQIENLKRALGL
jgi:hypothetical protein